MGLPIPNQISYGDAFADALVNRIFLTLKTICNGVNRSVDDLLYSAEHSPYPVYQTDSHQCSIWHFVTTFGQYAPSFVKWTYYRFPTSLQKHAHAIYSDFSRL